MLFKHKRESTSSHVCLCVRLCLCACKTTKGGMLCHGVWTERNADQWVTDHKTGFRVWGIGGCGRAASVPSLFPFRGVTGSFS